MSRRVAEPDEKAERRIVEDCRTDHRAGSGRVRVLAHVRGRRIPDVEAAEGRRESKAKSLGTSRSQERRRRSPAMACGLAGRVRIPSGIRIPKGDDPRLQAEAGQGCSRIGGDEAENAGAYRPIPCRLRRRRLVGGRDRRGRLPQLEGGGREGQRAGPLHGGAGADRFAHSSSDGVQDSRDRGEEGESGAWPRTPSSLRRRQRPLHQILL